MNTDIPPHKTKILKSTMGNKYTYNKMQKQHVSFQNSEKLNDLGYSAVTNTALQDAKTAPALHFKRCTELDTQNQPSS